MKNRGKQSKKRIGLIIGAVSAAVILLVTVVPFCLSGVVYTSVFAGRFETQENLRYEPEDFEGLIEERMTFESYGRKLQGYFYSREDVEAIGLVVICHGFGSGSNVFMDSADFFVKNGFYTFTFDVTGNDLSEGNGTRGIPQYTIDLDSAISFIRQDKRVEGLPVMLFGHSMGGFSVCNVLNMRDDIASVAEMAGFCESTDMMTYRGLATAGRISLVLLPYVRLYELILFGDDAKGTAVSGLKNSSCTVMVIHSSDDDIVPPEYGYDRLYNEFGDDDRFTFIRYEDRGHKYLDLSEEAREYMKQYTAGEPVDRALWTDALDLELYGRILDMFKEAAGKKG